jgi:hypothetical protein
MVVRIAQNKYERQWHVYWLRTIVYSLTFVSKVFTGYTYINITHNVISYILYFLSIKILTTRLLNKHDLSSISDGEYSSLYLMMSIVPCISWWVLSPVSHDEFCPLYLMMSSVPCISWWVLSLVSDGEFWSLYLIMSSVPWILWMNGQINVNRTFTEKYKVKVEFSFISMSPLSNV